MKIVVTKSLIKWDVMLFAHKVDRGFAHISHAGDEFSHQYPR